MVRLTSTKDIYSLLLVRSIFTSKSTGGDLWINGQWFCYTLEDVVRYAGLKVYGQTAIPEGHYPITVTMSSHFGRETPRLSNVKGFDGVLMHGGNTSADTQGCVLVAFNRVDNDRIQGSAEEHITELLKQQTIPIYLSIVTA